MMSMITVMMMMMMLMMMTVMVMMTFLLLPLLLLLQLLLLLLQLLLLLPLQMVMYVQAALLLLRRDERCVVFRCWRPTTILGPKLQSLPSQAHPVQGSTAWARPPYTHSARWSEPSSFLGLVAFRFLMLA